MLHERFFIGLSMDQVTDLLRFATGTEDATGLDYLSFVKHVHGGRSGLLWSALRPHLQRILQNTSVGTAVDPMPCSIWHLFAAFDTTRSNWVTHQQLGVALRSLGLPTCSARLRELCAETVEQKDDDSSLVSVDGFGFSGFCRALGVDDAAGELDRAARWVSRQRHIWDVVQAHQANEDTSDSESGTDRVAHAMGSPLSALVESRGDEERAEGDKEREIDRSAKLSRNQQSLKRQQYCAAVRSIAERRALTQGLLQALDARSAT
eukprot:COSAG02_NODE_611_length_19555_cov_34.449270_3_plen_264_part_00